MAIKRIYSKDRYYTINDEELVSVIKDLQEVRKNDEKRHDILIKELFNQLRKVLKTDCYLTASIVDDKTVDVIEFEAKAEEDKVFTEVKIDDEKKKLYIEIEEDDIIKYYYKIVFAGFDERIVYILTHKKKFSKNEIHVLLKALSKRNAMKYLMNHDFRYVSVDDIHDSVYKDLLNLGFEDFSKEMTISGVFCGGIYDDLLNDITKDMTEEEEIRIIKKYYPESMYYED